MSQLNMELRRQGVTGSEIAAVAGLSPYAGPLEIWARKLGRIPPKAQTPDMRRGTILEPALCQWAADERGLYGEDVGTLQCAEHPLVIASPDRILHSDPDMTAPVEVLEVKAPARTQHHWTRPEDDPAGIDPQYLPQVTWEMAASGLHSATVGALCYGDLWLYRLTFDEELFGLLLGVAERFWTDHVETGAPPPVSSGADADVLRYLHPTQREPLAEADEATAGLVAQWRESESAAKVAAAEAKRAKAQVMERIGDLEGYEANSWKVTWRSNRPSKRVNWEAVARAASATDDLIAEHTTEKPGARVLRYTQKRGSE